MGRARPIGTHRPDSGRTFLTRRAGNASPNALLGRSIAMATPQAHAKPHPAWICARMNCRIVLRHSKMHPLDDRSDNLVGLALNQAACRQPPACCPFLQPQVLYGRGTPATAARQLLLPEHVDGRCMLLTKCCKMELVSVITVTATIAKFAMRLSRQMRRGGVA